MSGRRCSLSGCAAAFWRQLKDEPLAYHNNHAGGLHDRLRVLPEALREKGRIERAGTEDVVHDKVVLLVLRGGALLSALLGALGALSHEGDAIFDSDTPDPGVGEVEVRLGSSHYGGVVLCR